MAPISDRSEGAVESTPRDGGTSIGLYVLFFCSGVSGLIYQVLWVRQFARVFGNTVYSGSVVVAIFMLGLGVGSYLFGARADRRHASGAVGLVRMYAGLEVAIATLGLGISLLLPHLTGLVSQLSAYEIGPGGWRVLSTWSYVVRAAVAVLLLGPITCLMGGTLTVLVRAVARIDDGERGWPIGLLYGINTLGAALGAMLTDFALVPVLGLLATQFVAVALNVVAAAGAYALAARRSATVSRPLHPPPASHPPAAAVETRWTAAALALSGFAALGMEILWLRHMSVLLGGFRAVFSLLLTVMLIALGIGALIGGWLDRRFTRPAATLMGVQVLFAVTALIGLVFADASAIMARGESIAASLAALSPWSRAMRELWFNLRPMLLEIGVPALVAGLAFPLANAIVQRTEDRIGRRAGVLYAANTIGAVCGSLVTGFLLLPRFGMQTSAALLAGTASLAIVPLYFADARTAFPRLRLAAAIVVAVAALFAWAQLPKDFIVERALGPEGAAGHAIAMSEGITELLAVVERPGRGRGLLTNGHAMSSTAILDQRYMRALAHIPLLSMSEPTRVLVIGFGVGNTTHAATLHASVKRVEVADISRDILDHAGFFRDANHDALRSPKVDVFVNDGRQHLEMAAPGTYDLITLEPPPIAHAGVAALYSREFYELAQSRLTPGGYISQWLPAYQVPEESSLAMVRAFVDVFPQAVLLSGTQAELLLVGTTARRIELDPDRVAMKLQNEPAVRDDLIRLDLGSVRDIAGTFVGSAATLARATSSSPAVTDDRPLQEYGVRSGLTAGLQGVPASLFDVTSVAAWCPRCDEPRQARRGAANLDLYLRLLQQAYFAPVTGVQPAAYGSRRLLGSAYLGTVVPDSAEVHNLLGLAQMREGDVADAVREFQGALDRDPTSANARANLGQIRYEQGAELLEARQFSAAAGMLRSAIELMPDSAEAHNDLGVALASMGQVDEAADHFRRAVELQPEFAEARRNLEAAKGH
jgi:spermidine synthase